MGMRAGQAGPDDGGPGDGDGEDGDRGTQPLPGPLPSDGGALIGASLLPQRGPGQGEAREPGALQDGSGGVIRPEQDAEGDYVAGAAAGSRKRLVRRASACPATPLARPRR